MNSSGNPSSGNVSLIGGIVIMLAAVALYCAAFEAEGTNSFAYWLWALALSFVGVSVRSVGIKQWRVAAQAERREALRQSAANDPAFGGSHDTNH